MPSRKRVVRQGKAKKSVSKKLPPKNKGTAKSAGAPRKRKKRTHVPAMRTSAERSSAFQAGDQALLEGKQKNREFAESLPQVVFETDEKGNLTFVNRIALEKYGYTKEDFDRGLSVVELVVPEDRDRLRKDITSRLKGEELGSEEYSALKKDGSTFPVVAHFRPVTRENRVVGLRGIVVDITERKLAQEKLAETNKLLETLLDHTHMMVAYLDPRFNFVKVNRAYAGADGRVPSFFPGKNHFNLYPNAENEEIFRRVVETGEPYFASAKPFEYAEHPERGISYWDWSLIPIKDLAGAVTGLVLTLVNVTERHRAEEALKSAHDELEIRVEERTEELTEAIRELQAEVTERKRAEEKVRVSEEKYKTLVETSSDMIFTVDLKGNFLFTNQAFEKSLGYSAEEIQRINGFDLVHPEDSKTVREQFAALVEGKDVDNMEYKYKAKDGSYISILNNASPIFDSRGNVVAAFGVARDITGRKRAEEELRKYRDHLEELVEERTLKLKEANRQLKREITERKQTEEALKAEKEFTETALNAQTDTFFVFEPSTGRVVRWNKAFNEISGYSDEEIRSMKAPDSYYSEEDLKRAAVATEEVLNEGIVTVELSLITKDGRSIPTEYTGSAIRDDEGNPKYIIAVGRNVTERRRAEEALEWELGVNMALAELSGALITPSSSIEDIANIVLAAAKRLTQSNHGYVSSIDPKTRDTVAHTLTKMMGKECLVRGEGRRIRFPVGANGLYSSLWGHALNSREAFLTNAPDKHEASRGVPGGHIPIKNFLSVPAVIGEELLGQIALANSPGDYTDRDLEAIKRLAELYAMAIQRKRAEEKINQQNEFLNTVIESLTHPFYVIDVNDYAIKAANSAAGLDSLSGAPMCYAFSHQRSKPCEGSEHPCPLKEVKKTKKPVVAEHIHYDKEGRARNVEVHAYPILDNEGNVVQMIEYCLDVTERKQAETALRESEEKFRNLAEQSPNMIFINKKGRVVYANRKCEQIMGYKREEFYSPDFDFLTLIAQEYRDLVKANFSRHIRGEEAHPLEYALIGKEGTRIEAILTSKLINYEGEVAILRIVTDITDRKRAEEALQKRTFDLDERVKELNCLYGIANLVQKPGISLEEILKGTLQLIPPAWRYPEITCARLVLEDQVFKTKNFRETIWRQASDIIVRGHPVGTLEVFYLEERPERDEGPFLAEERSLINAIAERLARITERRKGEEEIQKLNESLKFQAAELAAANRELEAFSYSVSHDLRAPLRTVEGFSRALVEDYSDKLEEEGKDYLRRIRAATQHMGQLINDLLNLSLVMRKEMRREKTNLSELVRAITAELQKTQPERQMEFVIQEGLLAHGDARLLREVLENLLSNAWKFTEKRSDAKIEFGATRQGGQTVYFVRDDGAGFDMTYVNKLFIPFQRLHSAAEFSGDGIGLAVASRIINRHGGRIWAEGEIEKGATFYFTLE